MGKINNYESVITLKPDTSEDRQKEIIEEIKKYMKKVNNVNVIGLRKLAYEVKKCTEGIYIDFYYTNTNSDNKKLEEKYKNTTEIIKEIIIKEED